MKRDYRDNSKTTSNDGKALEYNGREGRSKLESSNEPIKEGNR